MFGGVVAALVLLVGSLLFAATQPAPAQPAASTSTPPPTTPQADTPTAAASPTLADPATLKPLPTETPSPAPTATETPAPTQTPLPTPTPTPLPMPAWAEVGNLTTIEYLNTVVIERARSQKIGIEQVEIPIGTDRIVLMVVGRVHAGVDLQKIQVTRNGKAIRVVLPRAVILAVELQPEASRIFESDRAWIFSEYEGIELEAIEEANRQLRDNSAHNLKMLELAETMARLQLTDLLRTLGYEQIEIVFEP
jgi:hypothetical protein